MIDPLLLENVDDEVDLVVAFGRAQLHQAVEGCVGVVVVDFALQNDIEEGLGVLRVVVVAQGLQGQGLYELLLEGGQYLGSYLREEAPVSSEESEHHRYNYIQGQTSI